MKLITMSGNCVQTTGINGRTTRTRYCDQVKGSALEGNYGRPKYPKINYTNKAITELDVGVRHCSFD